MIIDTHCHLDDESFETDLAAVLERAKDVNIEKIIIPGASIKDLPKAVRISEEQKNIFFAVGVHPYHVDEMDESVLRKFAKHEKCVAVGECGLDYYRLPESGIKEYKARQKEVFIAQIKLACELKKPLIVHVRDANEDSLSILKEHEDKLVGGVLHCYNASPILLELSRTFYYGIGGVLTFKNEKKLGAILPQIPKERLLIETDAPYLTPTPHRGERNEPARTIFVRDKMSEILNLSGDEIERITTQNALKLFAI
ncbi:TatD family hydrolase [Campylobacter magnus]|uniref:TatD family hydrolase n=1 Tax=Campylobacter magnus TaxID=3026462 RepID=A0ABT8T688_9BACT|nr:TatD family hydrolase [Campylobacter magnus]MDO2409082.1 TatD family hydrolase [Campylobacter magnus]